MPSGKTLVFRGLAFVGGLTLLSVPVLWIARRPLLETGLRRALGNASIDLKSMTIDTFDSAEVSLSKVSAASGPHSVAIGAINATFAPNPLDGLQKVSLSDVALLWDPFAVPPTSRSETSPSGVGPLPFKEVTVNGTLRLGDATTAPVLQWGGFLRPGPAPQVVLAESSISGLNSQVDLGARLDFAANGLAVNVSRYTIDLSTWYPWLTTKLPDLASLGSVSGKVKGTATVVLKDGSRSGAVHIDLLDVSGAYPSANLALTGVSGSLDVVDLNTFATAPSQVIKIDSLNLGARSFTAAEVRLQGQDRTHVLLEEVVCTAFGGQVHAVGIPVDLFNKTATGIVEVAHLDLAEVGKLFPTSKFKFTGRVSGKVPIAYDSTGLHFGRGWLELDNDVPATLEFNQPGLITGSTSPSSPAYSVLKKVEDGLLSLKVKKMRVELYPASDESQRSATLQIEAEPLDPGVKAPVLLDLNINGPVAKLINWGTNSNLNFSTDLSH